AGRSVSAGLALDLVQSQLKPGLVAQDQEPRRGYSESHRITHDRVLRRRADLAGGPGHCRHAHGAVEIGGLEIDLGGTVGAGRGGSGPTWTRPENSASVASTGGLPCTDISPPSPPDRSLPRSARMPSIRRP